MILTIDGPSGSGKTTIAKAVAKKLNIPYFDTGAMYRAVAFAFLKQGVSLKDETKIRTLLQEFSFDIRKEGEEKRYFVGEEEVTEEIRSHAINEIVSEVAALPLVREKLWQIQRSYAQKQSAVFEGRDMGSVVFPKAEVKIFLIADPAVRAERRLKEIQEKRPEEAKYFDQNKMQNALKRRDAIDSSRELAPLKKPKGAVTIDTSHLTLEEVILKVLCLYTKKAKKLIPAWRRSKEMSLFYRFILCVAWMLFRVLYRHKVYGLEHFVKQATIIAPNHTSFLDPPIASISWPREVHFLARDYLFRPFLFGRMIRALNAHPVRGDGGDATVFKTILELLSKGKQVILFPEGGRTEGQIGEIKPGIAMLLSRSKAAIVPTYIHGSFEIWNKHHKLPKLFGKTACVFGSPILWEDFSHLEKKAAQEQITQEIKERLVSLKKWFETGAEGTPP